MTEAQPVGAGFLRTLDGVMKATFGPGALGRLGTVAIAGVVAIALLGLAMVFWIHWAPLVSVVLIVGLVVYFLRSGFAYARAFPEHAAMDGAQIERVMTRDVAMMRWAKDQAPPSLLEPPIDNPLLTDPERSPAAQETPDV